MPSGHWLEQFGFGNGALVSVTAKQGRIVLTVFRPAPPAKQQVSSRAASASPPSASPRARLGAMRASLRRVALSRRHEQP
jgi:hypothetical protein